MTMTKAAASVLGAWLILLLGHWVAKELYHMETHGQQSYVIDTGAEEVAAVEEEGPTIEEMMASADIGKGESVYKKCQSCHKLEAGANGTGPYLYGIVGRDIAAADGFGYSDALLGIEGDWTVAALDGFLEAPRNWAPGNKMSFSGLRKIEDRANLIAYLDSLDD